MASSCRPRMSTIAIASVVLPGGDPDQEQAGRPRCIEDAALAVRPGRRRVEVGAVGESADRERRSEKGPGAPGMPARESEAADDEREEDHVSERIGDVRRHHGGRAVGRVEDDGDQDRAADRGDRQGRGDPVDPDPGRQRPQAGSEQQDQADVARGIEAQVEHVRDRRVGRVVAARVEEQPEELRRRVRGDRDRERDPRTAVQRGHGGARDRQDRGGDDDRVVEAIVEEMRDRASVGKDGVSREGAEREHRRDLDREDAPPQIEPHPE